MKISELKSFQDVEVGRSYSMPSGDATLISAKATQSSSIGFKQITPENGDPFKTRVGCYTSLHIVFDEQDGRGGHRESFYFDMDLDAFASSLKKVIHIFKNCDSEGDGKRALLNDIQFDLGLSPLVVNGQEVVVTDNEELAQAMADAQGTAIAFERVGDPIDTGKIKNGKAVTYQRKKVYTMDLGKLCNVVEQIASAIQNNLVGTTYYLSFDGNTCNIQSA